MALQDLVYKELSFQLVGLAFEAFNILGPGHLEKYYQNAYEELLKREMLSFRKQVYLPLEFNRKIIGKNFIDLIIEDKIVIEFKVAERFTKFHFEQTTHYLKHSGHQLGLLILFSNKEVLYRRVLNLYPR